ncbi:uncharacterized protein LOC112515078 [Cynara cardunculus var. scolymus]|uniref:Transmembrane protein n=1 Tax=Cynara cardunculus var. scolymus TaxID=59895 RepID=A0A103YJD2_CYNCS|nr:uncharacterized protein LOC112515078 [Cynara cardunculus var. scolymus]KVI10219.1 hypothetical protein Ccrd_011383 [Cynara cardunculus var. scolymus]
MASAEAKSRWFPFANHCIVDEDYGRASRFPSFIPSSSKSVSEVCLGDGVPSNDPPANTKWWFNQKHKVNTCSFWNPQWETFATSVQNDENVRILELEAVIGDVLQKKPTLPEKWMEFDHDKHIVSDEPSKLLSELESQWIGIKKNEPWWRTTDLDDLASFVSQKSLEHFDNCDLPLPQTNKTKRLVCEKGLASLGQELEKEKSSFTDFMPGSPTSMCTDETQYTSGVIGCSSCGLDRPCSTRQSDETENLETPNSDLSKTQLLEALCHSQRRAREAERAAQAACNEKEHVIALFLRQASQIFAYKQWLHILQLEALCLQLRHSKYQPFYTRFPDVAPWFPTKVKLPKSDRKATERKLGSERCKMHESVGNFLWGLALVGAGVLLGWTLGWLFPAF